MENLQKIEEFKKELEHLINRHSLENYSNTPDFVLADYLVNCLQNFDQSVNRRNEYYDDSQSKKS